MIFSILQAEIEAKKRWGPYAFALKTPADRFPSKQRFVVGAQVLDENEQPKVAVFGEGTTWDKAFSQSVLNSVELMDYRDAAIRAYRNREGEISGDE